MRHPKHYRYVLRIIIYIGFFPNFLMNSDINLCTNLYTYVHGLRVINLYGFNWKV